MKEDLEKAREEFDQYSTVDNEECRMKLCLYLTLYQNNGLADSPQDYLNFYQQWIEHIGPYATYFHINGTRKFKKIQKDTLDFFPYWIAQEEERGYGLCLESGRFNDEVSDRSFQFFDEIYLKVILPLEWIEESIGQFLELVKKTVDPIQFCSGHAGIGTNIYPGYDTEAPDDNPCYALSRRYKGVDIGNPYAFWDFAAEGGIKTINWLTFLETAQVKKLGGTEALKQSFSKEIVMHELQHGVCIQAGPKPELGDVNSGEELPLYHEVGKALQPLRIPDEILREYNYIGGTANTRAWLDRFYPDDRQ